MLVISRKNGQKIMINDNIVITVVESRNGQVKLAIDADRDVKIYREEIYYQIKLAILIGTNANVNSVNSVSNMLKNDNIELNKNLDTANKEGDIELDKSNQSKTFIIKKDNTKKNI